MSRSGPPGVVGAARALARLKWSLLRGGLRGSNQQRFQTWLSVVMSVVVGALGLAVLAAIGRGVAAADEVVVLLLPVSVIGVGLLSSATGVESTIDARHLASEPIGRWSLGVGLLAAAAVGPPAVLAGLVGIGIVVGWTAGGVLGLLVVALAVVAWWITLVVVSRTATNLLGVLASTRFRQVAQAAATLSALITWLGVQLIARDTSGWGERWDPLVRLAAWTPPGQLGRAVAEADRPASAVLHLLLGVAWLPLLVWASVATSERMARSSPRPGGGGGSRRRGSSVPGLRKGYTSWLPSGPAGAITTRTIRTKFRTPRQAVNTFTALAVGAGVFLIGPVLDSGTPDPRIVLVGGLLHFAVLFDGNNAFGMDGPAIWMEIGAGADAGVLVRGKLMSSLSVMALPAFVLPIVLAVMSDGWVWLPASWLLAVGSVLAAAGVSVASAALAPFALPDSPNPLAAGDTGQGCVAGLMLAACMFVLVVVSAPVAIAVTLASERSVGLTVLAAVAAPLVGAATMWGGGSVARARLRGREAELVTMVTPAR
ncbi:MAG: hypothetical protein M3Y51_10570 [Actinomycetota bacterium]|nr:hypothetical protein [Actinomycetota bacterium]